MKTDVLIPFLPTPGDGPAAGIGRTACGIARGGCHGRQAAAVNPNPNTEK